MPMSDQYRLSAFYVPVSRKRISNRIQNITICPRTVTPPSRCNNNVLLGIQLAHKEYVAALVYRSLIKASDSTTGNGRRVDSQQRLVILEWPSDWR